LKESGLKEVELHEDDPEAVLAMLRHIYGLTYDEQTPGGCCLLSQHASVFVVAEKYQISGLRQMPAERSRASWTPIYTPLETF